MPYETLKCETSPRGVVTVTLNRPERGNPFNQQMMDEMIALVGDVGRDDRARVVVLRGAGKHFSTGADIGMARGAHGDVKHSSFVDLFIALDACPKPTLAAVQGACVGGAAAVVACCDVVIATDAAFFSIPEVRIGVAPVGVTPPLVRAMGLVNYRRYALSGERIPAAEAHRIGLAGRLCKAAEVEVAVTETVEAFLQGAPAALRDLKAHLAKVYPETTDLLRAAAAHHEKFDAFSQPDALEGVAAFKEKRRPKWYPA